VPEPSSIMLLLTVVGAVVLVVRKNYGCRREDIL
jgi:hypothetical protein